MTDRISVRVRLESDGGRPAHCVCVHTHLSIMLMYPRHDHSGIFNHCNHQYSNKSMFGVSFQSSARFSLSARVRMKDLNMWNVCVCIKHMNFTCVCVDMTCMTRQHMPFSCSSELPKHPKSVLFPLICLDLPLTV